MPLFQRRYPASDRSVGAADPRAEGFKYRDSELRKTGEGVVSKIEVNRKAVRF